MVRLRLARLRSNLRRQLQEAWRKAGQRLNSVDRTLQYLGPVNSKRIEPWTEASAVEQAVTLMAGNEDDEASKQTAIPCHLSDVRFQTCALDLLSASIGITTYHHDLGQEQTLLKLDPLMSLLQLLLFSYSFSWRFKSGKNLCSSRLNMRSWPGTSLEWTVWQQFWELHHVHHKASPS